MMAYLIDYPLRYSVTLFLQRVTCDLVDQLLELSLLLGTGLPCFLDLLIQLYNVAYEMPSHFSVVVSGDEHESSFK